LRNKLVKKAQRSIRYILEAASVYVCYRLIRALPRRVNFSIASFCGFLMYSNPFFRKLVKANLKIVFPEKTEREIGLIARKSFTNLILSFLELAYFTGRPETVKKYVYLPDRINKEINDFHKQGKGFIFVTPHLGNWEIAGMMFANFFSNIPFAVVARVFPNPYLNKILDLGRLSHGNKVISAKGAIKGMVQALKEGYFMATLIDQNTRVRDGGIFVNFLGLPVPSSRAPAMFARKMNVPVGVGGCVRHGLKYEVIFEFVHKKIEDYKDDTELIQDLLKITESYIRKYPEQYLWFYKRFQHIPMDASEDLIKKYPYYASIPNEKFYRKKGGDS